MHDRVMLGDIGKIEEVNQKLKDRFDYYQARVSDLERKSARAIPKLVLQTPSKNLESMLKSSISHLESLKREKSLLESSSTKTLQDLENQKKQYQNRLNILKSENNSLKSRSKSKSIPSSTSEKEDQIEIENLKSKIQDLENTHKKNQETLKDLQSAQKKVKKKSLDEETIEENEETKELKKLQKAENHLQTLIRSNENKYKQMVKDLESTIEKLKNDKVVMQMRILKTTQQERLLQMNIEQGESELNDRSIADANFLYKPSLKGLYH